MPFDTVVQYWGAMVNRRDERPAVLFVCLGNICRSPMAEGALRAAAERAGIDVIVDSAGTANYHVGEPPDPRAIATAAAHGVDIGNAKGRQLSSKDFDNFTHILALDKANLAGIKARAPRQCSAMIAMLLDVFDEQRGEPVADPYYGDDTDFERCWRIVDEAAKALVQKFARDCAGA